MNELDLKNLFKTHVTPKKAGSATFIAAAGVLLIAAASELNSGKAQGLLIAAAICATIALILYVFEKVEEHQQKKSATDKATEESGIEMAEVTQKAKNEEEQVDCSTSLGR